MKTEVTKDALVSYYIEDNHSKEETRVHFNLTDWTLSQLFKKYRIRKSKESRYAVRKKTNLERYGSETYNNREKFTKTCLKVHGAIGFADPEWREKVEQTVEKKYGNRDIRKTEYFKEKVAQVKLEKYGDSRYNNVEQYRETCQRKYGVPNPQQVLAIQEKTSETCQSRYGYAWSCMRPEARSVSSNDSKPNQAFAALLDEQGIIYEREFPITNRSYDFKVGQTLIEINPFPTHNSTWGIAKGEPTSPKYHFEKTQLAEQNGYRCIHVWDWDDREKILMMLQERKPLYARKLNLQEISQIEANRFLKQFHLQGGSKGQTVCLGLFQEEELIEVMTFGKPRFNKNYEWELIRLCTKPGIRVVGGAERLLKYFKNLVDPKSIVSYCDRSKFSGEVYTRLGFLAQPLRQPSRHWYNGKTGVHITDNGLRMQGFDRLLGDVYGTYGKGTSNEDLMRQYGFVEIWDAGQAVYVWKVDEAENR